MWYVIGTSVASGTQPTDDGEPMPLLAQKIRPLDGAGRGPLYRQLETALREALRDNLLKPNEALPAERDLAADLSVSRITLRKAIDKLVDEGLLAKSAYKEPGRRSRFAYELTDAGRDLRLVLGALQQWGDVHRPGRSGLTEVGRTREGGAPVRVALVDSGDAVVTAEDVDFRYAI